MCFTGGIVAWRSPCRDLNKRFIYSEWIGRGSAGVSEGLSSAGVVEIGFADVCELIPSSGQPHLWFVNLMIAL